ncbi:MAG: anti-sigma factor [Actinomycetota bacterium]|nr:anti-sigma factor [Actinomycetota bacterium]
MRWGLWTSGSGQSSWLISRPASPVGQSWTTTAAWPQVLGRHAPRVSPLASSEANGGPKASELVPRQGPSRRWGVLVALAIVVVLFGGLFAQAEIRFDRVDATMDRVGLLQRAQLAAADPAALVSTLRTPANVPVLTVVSRPGGGDSFAMNSTLPPLDEGRIYQLWHVGAGAETPVAVLGPEAAVMFALPPGVTSLLVTVEMGPAPSRPSLPPVAAGRLST